MKHSQQTKDRCYQLRAAGANFKDIARICNVTEKTASSWCKENPDEIIKWLNDDEREFIYFHRHLLATKVERIDDLARKLMDRLHRDEVGMGMMPYEKAAKLFINLTNTSTKLMHIGIPKEATFPVRMRQTHIQYQKLTRQQLAEQESARQQKKTSQNPTSPGAPLCKRRKAPNSAKTSSTPNAHPPREASLDSAGSPRSASTTQSAHPNPPTLTGNSQPSETPKPSKNHRKSALSALPRRQTNPQKPVIPTAPTGAPICNRRSASKHGGTSKTSDIVPSRETSWTADAPTSFSSVPEACPSTGNCQTSNTPKLLKNPSKPAVSAVQLRETKPQKPVVNPLPETPNPRELASISGSTPQPLTDAEIAYIENSPDDPTPEEQIKIMSIFEKLTTYYQYLADQEDNSN